MLDNLFKVFKISALGMVMVLGVCVADTLKHVKDAADATTTALSSASRTLKGVDSALNDPDKGIRGTLQNTNAILIQVGLTADEIRRTSMEQRVAARKVDEKILDTVGHVNVLADSAVYDLHATSLDVRTVLNRLPPLLDATTAAVNSTNELVSNSDIAATLHNINLTTGEMDVTLKHVAGVTANLETMSGELSKSLHRTLNPTKKSLALGYVMTALKFGAALSPLY